jgi:hypothetical protein
MRSSHQRRGGAPTMWGRAERQASAGADVLFARLNTSTDERAEAVAALERLVARIRAGDWSDELVEFVAQAAALERSLAACGDAEPNG